MCPVVTASTLDFGFVLFSHIVTQEYCRKRKSTWVGLRTAAGLLLLPHEAHPLPYPHY